MVFEEVKTRGIPILMVTSGGYQVLHIHCDRVRDDESVHYQCRFLPVIVLQNCCLCLDFLVVVCIVNIVR